MIKKRKERFIRCSAILQITLLISFSFAFSFIFNAGIVNAQANTPTETTQILKAVPKGQVSGYINFEGNTWKVSGNNLIGNDGTVRQIVGNDIYSVEGVTRTTVPQAANEFWGKGINFADGLETAELKNQMRLHQKVSSVEYSEKHHLD